MFLEPHFKGQRNGWIEVITGSMFSGKTEELIRRLKRAQIANQVVEIFKPDIDLRYDAQKVVSHDANSIHSTTIRDAAELLLRVSADVEVVGIDEAQFFDAKLPEQCQELALQGKRIIVAGLDMDFKGRPFGPMPFMPFARIVAILPPIPIAWRKTPVRFCWARKKPMNRAVAAVMRWAISCG